MKDYHINVFYSEEDEAYVADLPDLESCLALGETANFSMREAIWRLSQTLSA